MPEKQRKGQWLFNKIVERDVLCDHKCDMHGGSLYPYYNLHQVLFYMSDKTFDEIMTKLSLGDKINYLFQTNKLKQTYVITPRIFQSNHAELLKKAKQLYNSDKSPIGFMVKSNVDFHTTEETKSEQK